MNEDLHQKIATACMPLDGWTTLERLKTMADLITTEKPETVVELGVFGGRSFIAQALALQAIGEGVIYGVDPWRKEAAIEGEVKANADWWAKLDLESIHRQAMNAIWCNSLEQHAVIVRSESQNCYHLFDNIDVINIDANHSELASCRDFRLYFPRVKRKGWIFVDDTDWSSTQKMVGLLDESCDLINNQGHWRLYRKR